MWPWPTIRPSCPSRPSTTAIWSSRPRRAGDAYVKDTDYSTYYDGEFLVIEALADGKAYSASQINVAYNKVKPASVDDTAVAAGMESIELCMTTLGIVPDLICAPGHSQSSVVAAVMATKAGGINGMFQAKALIDIDSSSSGATSYTVAITEKSGKNFVDVDEIPCWPMLKLGDYKFHMSTQLAGLMAQVDTDNGGCPYESPSNKSFQCDAMVLEDGTEVNLTLAQANILNDNGMSINASMGGIAQHLAKQRLKPQYLWAKEIYRKIMRATPPGRVIHQGIHKIKEAIKASLLPCSMFEDMGFTYLGPVDGHDVAQLTKTLRYASTLNEPVVLHIRTVKGKGFAPAEANPDAFHGVSPFDPETGKALKSGGENFSAVFGRTLVRLARTDRRVCAMTAAMVSGTGLVPFSKAFPKRFFDVGIAEGCAVSMAAGMAKQGAVPVFAVYSTFLQRSYDMLLHDVAIDRLHVVFAVDRASGGRRWRDPPRCF